MHQFLRNRIVSLLALVLLLGTGTAVFAQTIVEPLPENNLIENPWFRQGNQPSLAGWIDAAGDNVIWSTSQKQSNPSPDQVIGTSARMAFGSGQGGGIGQGGTDAYLYQVVSADPALRHLQFKIHWVTVWIDRATVTLYGGDTADGPWTAVWVPFDVNQSSSSAGAWTQTELLETTIAEGYPFYKIELFARYPEDRQQGAKFTGVYFSVDDNVGAVAELAAPEAAATQAAPTTRPVRQTAVPPTNTPMPTGAPVENAADAEAQPTTTAVAAVSTPELEPTQPAAQATQPSRPTSAPDAAPSPANDSISPTYTVVIGVLLLLVIILGIGWARAARR